MRIVLILGAGLLLFGSEDVSADPIRVPVVDQSVELPYASADTSTSLLHGFLPSDDASNVPLMAQSFRVGITGQLTAVEFLGSGGWTTYGPQATVTAGIWQTELTDAGRVPVIEGTGVLGSRTFAAADFRALEDADHYTRVEFLRPIAVSEGDFLAFVLRPYLTGVGAHGLTTNPYLFGATHGRVQNTPPYCTPEMTVVCGWSLNANTDFGFRTFVIPDAEVAPTPEPGTLILIGSGLAAAGWARRRRTMATGN